MTISVFLADDHAIVRDGLCVYLGSNPDLQVVGEAGTGPEAVAQVRALQPDVVLIDIKMPDLDGIEAARQILDAQPTTGVIFLTQSGTTEHIFRALRAGARGYLLKESAGREVIEAVLAVSAGQMYLSQPVLKTLVSDYLQHRGASEAVDPLQILSQREREILPLVVEGKTSAEIAEILYLSPKTVESYRSRMMNKLGLPDISSLVRFAIQKGLVPQPTD